MERLIFDLILQKKQTMKNLINSILVIGFISLMSSCYVHTYNVGTGAQTGVEVKAKKAPHF